MTTKIRLTRMPAMAEKTMAGTVITPQSEVSSGMKPSTLLLADLVSAAITLSSLWLGWACLKTGKKKRAAKSDSLVSEKWNTCPGEVWSKNQARRGLVAHFA
jgi:hypothetical protein